MITMANKSDSLIIGYDSCGTDRTAMIVARSKGDAVFIINEFLDDEAKEMYKKLTTYNGNTMHITEDIMEQIAR